MEISHGTVQKSAGQIKTAVEKHQMSLTIMQWNAEGIYSQHAGYDKKRDGRKSCMKINPVSIVSRRHILRQRKLLK